MTADGQQACYATDEQKAEMVASVEGMILSKCVQFVRRERRHERDNSTFDDAAQECRLYLWKLAGTFRLDGPAKWSSFAHHAIVLALRRFKESWYESTLQGRVQDVFIDMGYVADPRPADEPDDEAETIDPDELDTVERSLDAVRRAMFAPVLETLTPAQRRLAEMVVFGRLSLPQVADQLGHKLNIVEKNFRGVLTRLHAKGVVTDEMAAKFGVTIRKPTPMRKWAFGEEDRFLTAVKSDRSPADIAAEFGVRAARVTAVRRNIVAILARHAKRREAADRPKKQRAYAPKQQVAYVRRERFVFWPAEEKERFRAAITSDRCNHDIAAEFRIDYRRVYQWRKPRPSRALIEARRSADPCPA